MMRVKTMFVVLVMATLFDSTNAWAVGDTAELSAEQVDLSGTHVQEQEKKKTEKRPVCVAASDMKTISRCWGEAAHGRCVTQAADGKCRKKRNKTGKNCPDACKLFEGATVTKKDGEYCLSKDIWNKLETRKSQCKTATCDFECKKKELFKVLDLNGNSALEVSEFRTFLVDAADEDVEDQHVFKIMVAIKQGVLKSDPDFDMGNEDDRAAMTKLNDLIPREAGLQNRFGKAETFFNSQEGQLTEVDVLTFAHFMVAQNPAMTEEIFADLVQKVANKECIKEFSAMGASAKGKYKESCAQLLPPSKPPGVQDVATQI